LSDSGRPLHASLRKGSYLLPRDANGTSPLAKVESDPCRSGIHEQRWTDELPQTADKYNKAYSSEGILQRECLIADVSLETRDEMKEVPVKDDERQTAETDTRQCSTPTRPSDFE
jgi:hypothetical protein